MPTTSPFGYEPKSTGSNGPSANFNGHREPPRDKIHTSMITVVKAMGSTSASTRKTWSGSVINMLRSIGGTYMLKSQQESSTTPVQPVQHTRLTSFTPRPVRHGDRATTPTLHYTTPQGVQGQVRTHAQAQPFYTPMQPTRPHVHARQSPGSAFGPPRESPGSAYGHPREEKYGSAYGLHDKHLDQPTGSHDNQPTGHHHT